MDQPVASTETTGYLHRLYSESLSEFGTPRWLPECGGWILERAISSSSGRDAMGCYPLFACANWSRLQQDLASLEDDLVSLALVTDPFGDYDPGYLAECFPDVMFPFKEHFVVELSRDPDSFVHPHHRRNARKALEAMHVEKCDNPDAYLDDWVSLYGTLVERHQIRGLMAFSPQCFAKQLRVPGLVMLRAVRDETTIGIVLWYQQRDRAYYHLGAYSPEGYESGASFALFNYSIEYFGKQNINWLDLGAGAGTGRDAESGLARFRRRSI